MPELTAHVPKVFNPNHPSRIVLVDDPREPEAVTVSWRLDHPRRWRCSIHGWSKATPCDHVRVARKELAWHLLLAAGERRPEPTTR